MTSQIFKFNVKLNPVMMSASRAVTDANELERAVAKAKTPKAELSRLRRAHAAFLKAEKLARKASMTGLADGCQKKATMLNREINAAKEAMR